MTWSVRITDKDGNKGTTGWGICGECQHRGKWPYNCYVTRVADVLGAVLTSVDVGADGHMACGTAQLMCSGFERIEPEPVPE